MATVEERLLELERKFSALASQTSVLSGQVSTNLGPKISVLEARAGAVEAGLTALGSSPPPPPPSFWEICERVAALVFDFIGKIAIPVLVVFITWAIKDSVDASLKRREIDVATGKAMQEVLTSLGKQGVTQESADGAALVLASMGAPSIPLLIREYNFGTTEASLAADKALSVLSMTHPVDLCESLRVVINDKGKRFRIETHGIAVKHIGETQCPDSVKLLNNLKELLGNANNVRGRFSPDPTPAALDELRNGVNNALSLLAY